MGPTYAKKRIDQMGWVRLVINGFYAGYPRNKKPMHEIATLYSLKDWRAAWMFVGLPAHDWKKKDSHNQ